MFISYQVLLYFKNQGQTSIRYAKEKDREKREWRRERDRKVEGERDRERERERGRDKRERGSCPPPGSEKRWYCLHYFFRCFLKGSCFVQQLVISYSFFLNKERTRKGEWSFKPLLFRIQSIFTLFSTLRKKIVDIVIQSPNHRLFEYFKYFCCWHLC